MKDLQLTISKCFEADIDKVTDDYAVFGWIRISEEEFLKAQRDDYIAERDSYEYKDSIDPKSQIATLHFFRWGKMPNNEELLDLWTKYEELRISEIKLELSFINKDATSMIKRLMALLIVIFGIAMIAAGAVVNILADPKTLAYLFYGIGGVLIIAGVVFAIMSGLFNKKDKDGRNDLARNKREEVFQAMDKLLVEAREIRENA
ncbi:MAG: hypothetical protein K5694_04675 [Bacilli bacterium]|nr:hypothetical protein [Bacilli bacterium]